ncbi:8439_t:CDS:2, partial [Diversispora eburnea]
KKESFENTLKDKYVKKFDYKTFENITRIASGAFGTVYRANSLNLGKHVALKCLHENDEKLYEKFEKELTNILTVNNHENIINFHGISIDPSTETHYLILQYAKDGDLRTYLQNNFSRLGWKIKINMAKDITSGLSYIHAKNIVHKDLHSKNILVHEGRLLITDLGLSRPLDSNSSSIGGGMVAYADPEYLRNQINSIKYKRDKTSDIYSLGVIFWELSSGRPFNNISNLGIPNLVISGKREKPINGTPKDFINIYSSAWKDDPKQRPTIENIFDSLENVQFENIYNNSNENNKHIQMEGCDNNQLNKFKPMESYSRDSMSIMSIESNNKISFGTSISLENLEIAVLGNPGESSPLSLNSYDQEWLNKELKKYGYNVFENIEEIDESIHNATLLNGKMKVTLKSIVVNSMELFVNEFKKHLNVNQSLVTTDPLFSQYSRSTNIYNSSTTTNNNDEKTREEIQLIKLANFIGSTDYTVPLEPIMRRTLTPQQKYFLTLPHDPRINFIPCLHLRSRMIQFQEFYDLYELIDLLLTKAKCHGDPIDPDSWECPQEFLDRYPYLVIQHCSIKTALYQNMENYHQILVNINLTK